MTNWKPVIFTALDASNEQDAHQIMAAILLKLGLQSPEPIFSHPGDRMWVVEAEIDISGVGVFEPDDARTVARYVIGQAAGMSWHITRHGDDELFYEWPPLLWLTTRPLMMPLHPAVRSMLIRVSRD
jgi:hypothetical protein